MKISNLIQALTELREIAGDLDVAVGLGNGVSADVVGLTSSGAVAMLELTGDDEPAPVDELTEDEANEALDEQ